MKKILSVFLLISIILTFVSFGAYAETSFAADIQLKENKLQIKGSGIKSIKGIVTVKIDAPDGNIFNINQIKADENGDFQYTVELLDTDAAGDYTVTVSTRETTKKISDTCYYLSELKKLEIINAFDAPADYSASLLTYSKELDIQDISDSELANAANMLKWLETDEGYDFNQIKTVINRSKSIWNSISECTEDNLTGFLKANSDVLFETEEVMNTYNGFSSSNKRAANSIILDGTFATYDDLRTVISNAVKMVNATIQKSLLYIQGDLNVNVIKISGNGVKTATKIVTLKITDKNGKIANINQIKANNDGTFSYSVTLSDNDLSGEYTVSAYSRAIDEISTVSGLNYLNKNDRDSIAINITSATGAAQIETILKTNATNMGLSALSEDDLKSAAVVINLQKSETAMTYNAVIETIELSKSIMDELNKAEWSSLDGFIGKNGQLLLRDTAEYVKYKNISALAERNKICKTIMNSAPFKNAEVFRTAFTSAVNAYIPPVISSPLGGGAGGGGGSSTKGGATSSAISGFNQFGTTPSGFSDLTNHEWARASIEGLLQRGIVSNAADGKFRPQDNVTREEFIKLLVSAFALTDATAQCNFSDVPADSWYYVYVASAYKNNITSGINENTFGTGADIKRQEMAALAYRVIKNLDIEIKSDGVEKTFNDTASIADYAKEAILVMQKAGVINGDETGNFRPEGNATRAEAAKVIYTLLASAGR